MDKIKFSYVTSILSKTQASEGNTTFLGYIEGMAATAGKDRHNEVISEKALRKGADSLLKNVSVFKNHKWDEDPVGKIISSVYMDDGVKKGIFVKIGISKTEPELWTRIEEGVYNSFSIGGYLLEYEYKDIGDEESYGLIDDMDVLETSIVGIPANSEATFGVALKSILKKSLPKGEKKMVEEVNNSSEELKKSSAELEAKMSKMAEMMTKMVEMQITSQETVTKRLDAIQEREDLPRIERRLSLDEAINKNYSAKTFHTPQDELNHDKRELKQLFSQRGSYRIILQGSGSNV